MPKNESLEKTTRERDALRDKLRVAGEALEQADKKYQFVCLRCGQKPLA
jgi:hypothetical protein